MTEASDAPGERSLREIMPADFHGPRDDIAIDPEQERLLDAAIEADNVFNIAIAGPLGSGKSSLIRSYEKDYCRKGARKQFAYVSLAAFGQDSEDKQSGQNQPKELQELEHKIVNQLAVGGNNRGKNRKIPRWSSTGYQPECVAMNQRRLQGALIGYLLLVVLGIAFIGASLPAQMPHAPQVIVATLTLLIALLVALGIWYFLSGCPPLIKSLAMSNAKVEMARSEDDEAGESFFDKNLAYVLKVFDDCGKNIFVFEDIDRIRNIELFVHLRELNSIVNMASPSGEKVTFVYCLSDDVLSGEERAKFFEAIISVVPHVDGYNSYGELKNRLKGMSGNISDRFLRNVALYIGDERIIKAIVNDYRIFYSRLNAASRNHFNCEKLLALMAIKGTYPKIFSNLERRRGKLYNLLDPRGSVKEELAVDEAGNRSISRDEISQAIIEDGCCSEAVDFVFYLVSTGRIDEGFYFYLANPDEQALSMNDREWIVAARNGVEGLCAKLDSPEHVLDYLEQYDLKKNSMANLSLIEWLTVNRPGSTEFVNLVSMLAERNPTAAASSVRNIPRFPAEATRVSQAFFGTVKGLSATPFVLSLLCDVGFNAEELKEIDEINGGFIRRELLSNAGSYDETLLSPYIEYEPNAPVRICDTMSAFRIRTEIKNSSVDRGLYRALLSNGLIKMTPSSCLTICEAGGSIQHDGSDPIEALSSMEFEKTWEWILDHAGTFVADYFEKEGAETNCSVGVLDSLLAKIDDSATRKRLMSHYSGKVENITALSRKSDWTLALENHVVEFNSNNAFKYLVDIRADESWASFVNAAGRFDVFYNSGDQLITGSIEGKALFCNALDDDKYELLCARCTKGLFDSYPGDVSTCHRAILYRYSLIELNNQATLADACNLLELSDLCEYECKWLKGFLQYRNQVGGDLTAEIQRLLEKPLNRIGEKVPELVDMLRSQIDLSPATKDVVAAELLRKAKLTSSGCRRAVARFGNGDVLDSAIVNYLAEGDGGNIEHDRPSIDAVILALPKATPNGCPTLIRYVFSEYPSYLWEALAALDNEMIDKLLNGKRPKMSSVDGNTSRVLDLLREKGLVSVTSDKRYVMKRAKFPGYKENRAL